MDIRTLVIGYTPLPQDTSSIKPAQLRNRQCFEATLKEYDLGEVCFAESKDYKEAIEKHNPFIIIVFGSYEAQEAKQYKKDIFVYVTDSPHSLFTRKAEVEQKQDKQREIFAEVANLVAKIRKETDPEKISQIRKVAGMGHEDLYEMVQKMLISDKPELVQRAWELLQQNHGEWVWIRARIVVEAWQHSDAKQKEQMLTFTMGDHVKNGMAEQGPNFTDEEGIEYKQYEFKYPDGNYARYIRRIPIATKDMDKWKYEALLEKYETPNGPRMMLEVGEAKKLKEKSENPSNL